MVTPAHIPDWLARLYPFTPKYFAATGGAKLSYLDEGPRSDEAVLMLHGNPTWSFYYRNLVRELAPTMRCVVPDHIGMGLSEKPPDYEYTLARRIDDVEALVASLGLRRVHLVVHDWGGAIGFGWAGKHAEMIGRLVILNTAAFPAERIPRRIALCKLAVLGPLLVRGLNGFAGPATWMAMHQRKLTSAERRAYLFPYDSWANRVAVNAFVSDIPMAPSHPSWPTLEAVAKGLESFRDRPALIVWGGRDFCFNQHFLGRWREIFPQGELQVIAGAGHYVLEDAQEIAVPLAAKFLRPVMHFPRIKV
ncbi:MAG: alpha/beta fold hydrolase [Opitutaceae bacterium]|nr:alpha/beta fold hydrolase [Opitutaceae bacterium]